MWGNKEKHFPEEKKHPFICIHSFPFIFVNGVSKPLDRACNAAGANAGAETGGISILNNLKRGEGQVKRPPNREKRHL